MDRKERDQLLDLVEKSYSHWTEGKSLIIPLEEEKKNYAWLDERAPFGLLVQNTESDPMFIYANRKAQEIFGYTLAEFLAIPSRKSAPPTKRENREQMLQEVAKKGIFDGYKGTRIDKQGRLFEISKGSIWKVLDSSGKMIGTAAMIWVEDQ